MASAVQSCAEDENYLVRWELSESLVAGVMLGQMADQYSERDRRRDSAVMYRRSPVFLQKQVLSKLAAHTLSVT